MKRVTHERPKITLIACPSLHHFQESLMRVFICVAFCCSSMSAMADTISFDSDVVGRPPSGWTCGATGRGSPKWTVEVEKAAPDKGNVLRQSGTATFPWCIRSGVAVTDGWVEVKFKALAGKEDQAGGVVWRWKDGDNYYVARANALENNLSLYYTERGSRKTLKYVDARWRLASGVRYASSSQAPRSRCRSTANAISTSSIVTSPARGRSACGPRRTA